MSKDSTHDRSWLQFHENAAVIAFWQSRFRRQLAWLTPRRRRGLLLVGSIVVLLVRPAGAILGSKAPGMPDRLLIPLSVLLLVGLSAAFWLAARHYARLPGWVRRHPQVTLHAFFWVLLAVLWWRGPDAGPWRAVLAGAVVFMPFLIWRWGYLLLSGQRGRATTTRFRDHLLYLFPAWGGTNTPYGKGLDYLARCEAQDEAGLARSQLAGLRLFALSITWSIAANLMERHVYDGGAAGRTLGLPTLRSLVESGRVASIPVAWASMYCELFREVLEHAARGHAAIGVLRVFGFNVFRNTYKPLLSESISAFWNRYFYYFKELMSELFFMPVFARWFRKSPRLRLFAAVMAAAGVGNLYFHVLRREDLLISGDLAALWDLFHPRAFYCLLLALGIYVSMRREQLRAGVAPVAAPHRRALRILGVWTFFAVIYIWNVKSGADFATRTRFFASLFGLNLP